MNQHDDDPIAHLQDWARKTERKVRWGRRARLLRFLLPLTVAGVLVVAAVPTVRWALDDDDAPAAQTSAPDGVTATTTGSAAPASPFEGTAAATYPIGEAGITLPPARAVSGFSAAEVSESLTRVRTALILGRLDHDMIVDHRKGAFLRLLAPNARATIEKWFTNGSFSTVVTWIDPAVTLDPRNEPRVSGRVTYKSMVKDGTRILRVTTNFVWIYAFAGEFANRPLAVEHDQIDWDFPQKDAVRLEDRGMWIGGATGYDAWVDCVASKKGLLAPTPKDAAGRPSTEDQEALAKPDHSLDIDGNCA
ncbi:hypothetical protein GCM10010168_31280 [Actinoplanes ianthinogenes]|uniref:Uncharacterized protein n=1 Tax=Actinoplanes ianthinogenes TaxID=122358 RepID=A0ABN6C439_9ACTN|nr:hypothetical protein [Actinoplanes ianthinogenes]BCJ40270.1 hypothetical protein Aiant_09270 [Actinoplanes ianthinogenes]GGR11289.1 hypothetical protein GCM10010168_31280 [Actinoplanes ianthinogenes]